MNGMLPRAKDMITEADIEHWVSAAVRASLPVMIKETREVLMFAMREHEKVLEGQTQAMMRTLEAQTKMMSSVIQAQGRSMLQLLAFGGLVSLLASIVEKRDKSQDQTIAWKIVLAYGIGTALIFASQRG
mmetsp:Transcript_28541/g.45945  ORF Transcript_28541/g.45945 Transcript_28541/m.45945 type:complete len:130 (+) Transcript_28541:70-459(+)|eukprot:CAMPEP_0169119178 /NCGR_PEP_ID=MMETSP1015-20121227/31407_1 /TAXON_ID=342587 /ORGANISM="Karlodinium micrum, Strain CCMP2283" /LENGTH=129 /DNA_ID=CAMNT_0009182019 /DNA_START=67 /DNA_END=456 /DNA_ORIENTATION=-